MINLAPTVEDELRERIEELEAQLDAVREYVNMLCMEYRYATTYHRIGLDIKAAIKGDES